MTSEKVLIDVIAIKIFLLVHDLGCPPHDFVRLCIPCVRETIRNPLPGKYEWYDSASIVYLIEKHPKRGHL